MESTVIFVGLLLLLAILIAAIFFICRDDGAPKKETVYTENDEMSFEKSGYGYTPTDPIYTSSVHSTYEYLKKLRTVTGKKVEYTRAGAFYGVVCNGKKETAVDEYEITVNGKPYAKLYFCPYGRDSGRVPNGFLGSTENVQISTPKTVLATNESSFEKKITILYRSLNGDMVRTAFPGGKNQVGSIIKSLSRILNIALDEYSIEGYKNVLSVYTDVLIRKAITHSPDDMILTSLKVKHSHFIKDDNTANMVISFVLMNMKNNDFAIVTDEDLLTVKLLADGLANGNRYREQNEACQSETISDAEYGLVPEKPVYTNGVAGSNAYLNRLITLLGESLSWQRQGSMNVEQVNGIVDIYEGYLPSGRLYKTVYINMYGSHNSTIAPKGFKLL